jgi:prephenate dehydratase
MNATSKIAFQGELGAYSQLACQNVYPDMDPLPCRTFDDAFAAIRDGKAGLGMIPIENSVAGRVADIHHLMPDSGLHIIGEYFLPVHHHLLGLPDADITGLTHVHSHVHALNQCRNMIRELGVTPVVHVDTAGAAIEIAGKGDKSQAVIASELAGKINNLKSLQANIEDAEHNTTRFVVMAKNTIIPAPDSGPLMTTFVFRVRNVPAALYKALGGFATNGVNMTKLESYQIGGHFSATQFYADVEGHPEHSNVKLALEELSFFTKEVKIIGVYLAHPFRKKNGIIDSED